MEHCEGLLHSKASPTTFTEWNECLLHLVGVCGITPTIRVKFRGIGEIGLVVV